VLKKNIANMPDIARNIVMFAVNRERIRKIDSRTSGALVRSSTATNPASRTTASAKNPSVFADVHPADWASTIA